MAKSPDDRFASYEDLVKALKTCRAETPAGVPAAQPDPGEGPDSGSMSDLYAIVEQSLLMAEQVKAAVPQKTDPVLEGTATPVTMPASERFTRSTWAACSSMGRLRCSTPRPP